MVPSFVHTTVVAGEVVEVQIRVNRVVDVLLCNDVITGAAEVKTCNKVGVAVTVVLWLHMTLCFAYVL